MYYLIIMQNIGYEEATQAIFKFDDLSGALARYHNELGYRHESRHNTTCIILDTDCNILYREKWEG